MSKRAFIIHGYQSYPEEAWLPWIKVELEQRGYRAFLPAMPHPAHPVIAEWIAFIANQVREPDAETVMIGHSLGCQGVLRYLATLGAIGKSVAKTVLVAGSFPMGLSAAEAKKATAHDPVQEPWVRQGVDPVSVKRAAGRCTVILSDNDPYLDVEKVKMDFRATLAPEIVVVPGLGHFNEDDRLTELPAVLTAVLS